MPRPEPRRTASPVGVLVAFHSRRTIRSGALWGVIFGITVASSVAGYSAAYPSKGGRTLLAQALSTSGLTALFGRAHHLATIGGFTAWRSMGVLVILGAVWGLLAATRTLRGEEEAGRTELVLAGPLSPAQATGAALGALAAGWLSLWAVTAVLAVAVGSSHSAHFSVADSLYLATSLCTGAATFLAVGALTSQLAVTRRQANGFGAAVLGAALLLRVVADSSPSLGWVDALTPFGWSDQLGPLSDPRPGWLVAVALWVAVLSAVTVGLARRRDLGSGLVADRDRAPTRTRLLHSPLGLAVRTTRPVALGWLAGVVVVGLVFGLVAKSAALALQGSSSLHQALGRLGTGTGAAGYLGLAFLMVTVLVAVAAAGQVSATRDEEGLGHLEHLLVRPVRRVRWLAGRLVVATALIVLVGLAVGVAAWASSASQHSGVGFGPLLAAGANTVPPALVVLGAGTLVFGLAPRLAAAAAYAVVAWSFLVELVGSVVNANHWLLDTSLLHHVAPAPATGVRWSSAGILVLVAVAAAAAGAAAFDRRDLASA